MPTGGNSRDGSGYPRYASRGRGDEGLTGQLLAAVKSFEGQLSALRSEHELLRLETLALRRCLDRSGALSAEELEKEVQSARAEQASAAGSSTVSPTAASLGLSADSRPCSMPLTGEDASLARSRRSPSPRGAGPVIPLVNGFRSTSPLSGSRGRSPNKSSERAELDGRPKSRPRSRSNARKTGAGEEGEGEGGPELDLYELMSKLLDQSASVAEQQRAVRSVQQLLKRSTEPPNSWNGPGTPLSAVVRAGRADLARLLLRARANINERDAKGVSALHVATYDGNAELCRVLLVARADVDAVDRHGQTPLFFVPNREICKLLIERRSDVTVVNRKGQSALHLAGRAGLHEVLSWLSSRVSKSLADLRDVHGATARAYVLQSGVPRPEVSSPRASKSQSHRAASPRVPSRAGSPQGCPQRTAERAAERERAGSPRTSGLLRGGGGSQPRTAEPPGSGDGTKAEQPRGSGQLPFMTELVDGRAAAAPAAPALLEVSQQLLSSAGVAPHAAAVLEAAAAVATAAVATAAELEAAQKTNGSSSMEEVGIFDHEADTWPVGGPEAEDPAELDRLEAQVAAAPLSAPTQVTRAPGAVAPGAPLPPEATEVDLSEIGVMEETGEDLAELGVMDDVLLPANFTALAGSGDTAATAVPIQDQDGVADAGVTVANDAPPHEEEKQGISSESAQRSAELQQDTEDAPGPSADTAVQPAAPPSTPLLRLEDELDEVF